MTSKNELKARIIQYTVGIATFLNALERPSKPQDAESLENPLASIGDLASLCHAHTTKLGIAFRPPVTIDAAEVTLDDWMKLPMPLLSCYSCLVWANNDDVKDPIVSKVRAKIREIFECYQDLLPELSAAIETSENVKNSSEVVLKLIGRIWSNCDQLRVIASGDFGDIAAEDLEMYVSFAKDAEEELIASKEELNGHSYYDKMVSCLGLVVVLWNGIIKRRCKDKQNMSSSENLKMAMDLSSKISSLIDDIACELSDDEDVSELFQTLDSNIKLLTKTVRQNKSNEDDKFTEWIDKYLETYDKKIL